MSWGSVGDLREAAKRVRGLAERGRRDVPRDFPRAGARARAVLRQMVNTFDPDALIVGGGALEAAEAFQRWFLAEMRAGMPVQRQEQADIPIRVMPNGDTAGAQGRRDPGSSSGEAFGDDDLTHALGPITRLADTCRRNGQSNLEDATSRGVPPS